MRTKIILALVALASGPALAGNCGNDKDVGNADCTPNAVAGSNSTSAAAAVSSSVSLAGAVSGAISGPSTSSATGGTAHGNGYGGSGGSVGTVAVSVTGPTTTTPTRIENTPDVTTMIGSATAVCRIAFGAGGSGPGIGFSFGASMLDEGCDAREDARLLRNMGLNAEAVLRLCAKPEMAVALGAKCPAKP